MVWAHGSNLSEKSNFRNSSSGLCGAKFTVVLFQTPVLPVQA